MTLLTRLAQATGPDRELDALVAVAIMAQRDAEANADGTVYLPGCGSISSTTLPAKRYTASLDAVLGLLPEGWFWRVGHSTLYGGWAHLNRKHPNHCDVGDEFSANAATPAIALLIAILKARGIE